MSAANQEYESRRQRRQVERAARDRRRFIFGNIRFVVFLAGVAIAIGTFDRGWLSGWWLLAPGAAFFWLGGRLQSLEGESERLGRAEAFYERGLARLDGRWAGAGEPGNRFLDEHHLYARDLDLFGAGGLFELLCRARTRMGEETLAAWLLAPASPETVAQRQEAVRELAPRLNLREDIAVLGEDAGAGVHAAQLAAWGERAPLLTAPGFRNVARGLSVLGAVTLVAAIAYLVAALAGELENAPRAAAALRVYFLSTVLLFGIISWRFNARAAPIFLGAQEAARDVGLLAGVLERLERESFTAARLVTLRAALDTDGQAPSRRIARLNRLMEFVYQRDNMVVHLVGTLVLWDVHLAYALEDWRAASGAGMRRWLGAVGEIEALSSIAAYHYERPDDVFAELVDGAPMFEATAASHPLLPRESAVANDVSLGAPARVLIVSGSNMSGKSTLLRTVGVAAVLAQAGAPVRAARLRLSPLVVGASIRLADSLQDGESRFYAEILRLRAIVQQAGGRGGAEAVAADPDAADPDAADPDAAGPDADAPDADDPGSPPGEGTQDAPVLFLIDEFLHGTNSHDRRIGAEAIVRGLVERGAIGLVTTHDLALTQIADDLGERGANVHFEDHLEGGKMRFDYRMRSGVVEKSNALELMRSVGLDV